MAEPALRMTPTEYLEFDRASEVKHELWDGEVYAMTGASIAHNTIVGNLLRDLLLALAGSECRAFPSDMRVRIAGTDRYVYPDVTIVCRPRSVEGKADVVLNPRTIIEVLSPSTAAFDRGDKFEAYRSIPSLEQVLFVSQEKPSIESYTRQSDDSWLLREFHGTGAAVHIVPAAPISLASIYDDVDF